MAAALVPADQKPLIKLPQASLLRNLAMRVTGDRTLEQAAKVDR